MKTAQELSFPGRGILDTIQGSSNKDYASIVFPAAAKIKGHISGVILAQDLVPQSKYLFDVLKKRKIHAGVDMNDSE